MARKLYLYCVLFFGTFIFHSIGQGQEIAGPQSLPTTPLAIATEEGAHSFEVELTRTREEMRIGLMFRTRMADNHGMLFDYQEPQMVRMWMKNTYIPLDILFINPDGTILTIVENTTPLSLATISSIGPVQASLELNAGVVEKLGIEPGDTVLHKVFGNLSEGND